MAEEYRFDAGRLGKMERTPQGGVRIPANLTRTGILEYRTADGSVRKEYRPAEEVFRSDSLAHLDSAPVTVGHEAMVTSENWRNVSVGHVAEGSSRQDGHLVAAKLVIQDSSVIGKIEVGDLAEVSAGYRLDYDPTPGEYNGERYDGVQRNIRYNHIALLPKDGGRAGREVGLRLDSSAAVCETELEVMAVAKTIRIDGVDYEYGSETHIGKLEADSKTRLDAVEARCDSEKVRADKAEARADGEKVRADKAEADLATANDPKRLDAAVTERVELVTKARRVLGEEGFKAVEGKSAREIKIACVRVDDANFTGENKSDDYVAARFDALKEETRADSINRVPGILNVLKPSGDELDSNAARQRMIDRNRGKETK